MWNLNRNNWFRACCDGAINFYFPRFLFQSYANELSVWRPDFPVGIPPTNMMSFKILIAKKQLYFMHFLFVKYNRSKSWIDALRVSVHVPCSTWMCLSNEANNTYLNTKWILVLDDIWLVLFDHIQKENKYRNCMNKKIIYAIVFRLTMIMNAECLFKTTSVLNWDSQTLFITQGKLFQNGKWMTLLRVFFSRRRHAQYHKSLIQNWILKNNDN